jgi:hypothetical protein
MKKSTLLIAMISIAVLFPTGIYFINSFYF